MNAESDQLEDARRLIEPTGLDIALHHAALGRRVFPFRLSPKIGGGLQKRPIVDDWLNVATADEAGVRDLWRGKALRILPGWRLDDSLVVADVDDPQRVADAYLELPETARQTTPSGGYHLAYRIADGQTVRQTVRKWPGMDTRVGGRGWVGLYSLDAFDGEIADAPQWMYSSPEEEGLTDTFPIDSHYDLLVYAGHMRRAGAGWEEILAAFTAARDTGRLVARVEHWPWSDADLEQIARDIGAKPTVEPTRISVAPRPAKKSSDWWS